MICPVCARSICPMVRADTGGTCDASAPDTGSPASIWKLEEDLFQSGATRPPRPIGRPQIRVETDQCSFRFSVGAFYNIQHSGCVAPAHRGREHLLLSGVYFRARKSITTDLHCLRSQSGQAGKAPSSCYSRTRSVQRQQPWEATRKIEENACVAGIRLSD